MGMKVKERARMYRELGKLLGASFPMDKSIDMLLGQNPVGAKHDFLLGIQKGFAQKLSFSESMQANNQGTATPLELSLIDSGERSGRLAEACTHLAHYYDTWSKGVAQARSALVYPLIVLHMGVVAPEFARHVMLSAQNKETNLVTGIGGRILVFWLALVGLWFLWQALSKAACKAESTDRWLNVLPLIGSVRRHWALARFTQVFHSGLLASMRISECLHMAGDASQSGTLLLGSQKAASTVELGGTLSEGLADSQCFSQDFVNSIATSEASGGMDKEMARWAEAETESAANAQREAAEWYPKVLYFCILGYVGARIISFASATFDDILKIPDM